MAALPPLFADLIRQPAPGLVFEPHLGALLPERALATPHRLRAAPSTKELSRLRPLVDRARGKVDDVLAFYGAHDGCDLFLAPQPQGAAAAPAIRLLPLAEWGAATSDYQPGGKFAWQLEELNLYRGPTWRIVATVGAGDTRLALFFDGEDRGVPLAGKVFYLSVDPVLPFDEPLAHSFTELLERIAEHPVKFLNELGWTGTVEVDGATYGDTPREYLPDIRKHPRYAPPTR